MPTQNKTVETEASVAEFIATIANEQKRNDFSSIIEIFSEHTQLSPKMWGLGIVGFGIYNYKYESGREGTSPLTAIAPRANSIVLYLTTKSPESEELLPKLGKYKKSGGCIHIKKLTDIDTPEKYIQIEELIGEFVVTFIIGISRLF